jgi:hypothetical protein
MTVDWRQDPYNQTHRLVVLKYGPAKDHKCADCGEQAYDWTLNESKVTGPILTSGTSRYAPEDLEAYEPRCRRCHTLLDDNTREARAKLAELRQEETFRDSHAEATRQGIARARETDNRWGAGRK